MTQRPATWRRRFTENFTTEMRTWKKKGCTMPVPPQTCCWRRMLCRSKILEQKKKYKMLKRNLVSKIKP